MHLGVFLESLSEDLRTNTGPTAGSVGPLHPGHHQAEEGVARGEGEGVVSDVFVGGVDGDVLVLGHVTEDHVVSVQVETPKPPDQQHSQGVREMNHGILALLEN